MDRRPTVTATVDAPNRTPTPIGSGRRAAIAGILAAFGALAVGELLAAVFDALSPLVAGGGWGGGWGPPAPPGGGHPPVRPQRQTPRGGGGAPRGVGFRS